MYDFSKVDVLIVESTQEMFKLFKMVLTTLGVPAKNIDAAYSQDEGYRKFERKNHDLIISDWLENPTAGIKLIKEIRTNKNSPNKFVPIIMSAGSGHESRVIRSRDVGVNEYLVKPFSAASLAKRITRVIETPRPYVVSTTYTGPDRRVKQMEIEFEDRRKETQQVEVEH